MQRFADRGAAGRALAALLQTRGIKAVPPALVVGLARGGVIVAAEVARLLNAPLDVIVVRKLGLPGQPEFAMGAIAAGVQVLNEALIAEYGVHDTALDAVVQSETRELLRREQAYHAGHAALDPGNRRVLLVDDGIATGMTMLAAIRATLLRGPAQVIVVAPIASREACRWLRRTEPSIGCLCCIEARTLSSIGEHYDAFEQVSDDEVIAALAHRKAYL